MNTKLILTSLTALTLAVPALADPVTPNIAVGTNPADCTEPVLGTTSGTSNLEANWNANTLNLQWSAPDAQGWSAQNNTCTYDSGITVPQTNPSKTGYTFAGWRVVTASAPAEQTSFDLSTLLPDYANTDVIENKSKNFDADYCHYYNNDTDDEIESVTCNESVFSDLGTGEWKTTFEYGTVSGEARCSSQPGSNGYYTNGVQDSNGNWNNTTMLSNLTDEAGQEGARYCWCKATNYTPLNGTEQSVGASRWVFRSAESNAAGCAYACASNCDGDVGQNAAFRSAVYQSAQ